MPGSGNGCGCRCIFVVDIDAWVIGFGAGGSRGAHIYLLHQMHHVHQRNDRLLGYDNTSLSVIARYEAIPYLQSGCTYIANNI